MPARLQETSKGQKTAFSDLLSKWMSLVSMWHFLKAEAWAVIVSTYKVIFLEIGKDAESQ